MVALVWWRALFGSVTQKGIRAAAAPMNSFADYFGTDDLNVCKRARENGRSHPLEICGVAEIPVKQEGLLAPPVFQPGLGLIASAICLPSTSLTCRTLLQAGAQFAMLTSRYSSCIRPRSGDKEHARDFAPEAR